MKKLLSQLKKTKLLSLVNPAWGPVTNLCFFIMALTNVDFPTFGRPTIAIFIGFFLAAIFATFKLSKNRILNLIGSFYTTVFRGVPELLVIYLFFFWR